MLIKPSIHVFFASLRLFLNLGVRSTPASDMGSPYGVKSRWEA